MAIGEWTDGRAFWFFQALVESAKLDAGEENAHNLLVQGPVITIPVIAGMNVSIGGHVAATFDYIALSDDTNGTFRVGRTSGAAATDLFWRSEVTLRLYDRCPWNRIVFGVYVKNISNGAAAGTARVALDRRPATNPRTRVNLYELLVAGFTVEGWYGSVIDITGLTAEQLTLVLRVQGHQNAGDAYVDFGSPFVQLASSVAGV